MISIAHSRICYLEPWVNLALFVLWGRWGTASIEEVKAKPMGLTGQLATTQQTWDSCFPASS